jgi:uncharacterized membrane protein
MVASDLRREAMSRRAFDPRILAVTAIMTAIVFVLTSVVRIPTLVVGYIHLGDIGIFFSSFAFGPWVGAVAGGLGTALADYTSPWAQWTPFSLLIHGAQGLVVGWMSGRWTSVRGLILAALVGGVIVVVGYLLAGTRLEGFAAALTEVPFNIVQVTVGAIVAVPLYLAVRRAYPPVLRFRQRRQ